MGLLEILTIIFVLMKLFGVIDWSWWAVFLPTIIEIGLIAAWGMFLYLFSKKL